MISNVIARNSAIRAISVCGAMILLASTAAAAPKSSCLSRSEAKTTYKGAYLYWHRNAEGQRCWSSRRGDRIGLHRSPRQAVVVPRLPPPVNSSAASGDGRDLLLLSDLMPPWWLPLVSDTSWAWVAGARDAASELVELNYSSFAPGAEPDIWPALPQPARAIASQILVWVLAAAAAGATWWLVQSKTG